MGRYDGVFLYCDLDGTLLDDQKRVSRENRASIDAFLREGGRFGVATGRSHYNIGPYLDLLPINAPSILCNGAALYDFDARRLLALHAVDRARCLTIARRAVELQRDVCVQVFTDEAVYEPNPFQLDDPQTIKERMDCRKVPLEEIPEPFLKLLLCRPPQLLAELIRQLDLPRVSEGFSTFQSADVYLEFVAAGVTKGAALEDVRAYVPGIRKILAIGDYGNDVELVRLADVGAAPRNAEPAVKEAASLVLEASNNESAVARFLEAVL